MLAPHRPIVLGTAHLRSVGGFAPSVARRSDVAQSCNRVAGPRRGGIGAALYAVGVALWSCGRQAPLHSSHAGMVDGQRWGTCCCSASGRAQPVRTSMVAGNAAMLPAAIVAIAVVIRQAPDRAGR